MSQKDDLVRGITSDLIGHFSGEQVRKIEDVLYLWLNDYQITELEKQNTQLITVTNPDGKAYQMFFVAKKIEGLSENSLKYYALVLRNFLKVIKKPLATVVADDIRYFLVTKQNVTPTTLNNMRRVLRSFFTWLVDEDYVTKNPVLKIKNIKQPKVIKKPFTQTEIEELRDACTNLRDRAIVEVLLSTGMRCSELCGANISDIDFSNSEILVTGKGNKQRICYLNAPAKKRLKDYFESRTDGYVAMFTSLLDKGKTIKDNRLKKGGVLNLTKRIGSAAGVKNVHPHRFRRTAATMVLQRGMPVEQVKIMLGHVKIDTTIGYAITADETVKQSHSRYM